MDIGLSQVQNLFQSAVSETEEVRDLLDVRPKDSTEAIAIDLSVRHRATLAATNYNRGMKALEMYLASIPTLDALEYAIRYGYGVERLEAIKVLGGVYADNPRA